MWCHLVLAMPVAGLALFFVLPWPLALAGYVPIAGISVLIYYKIAVALRLPVQTGRPALIGSEAEVICPARPGGLATHLVRCQGEMWSVRTHEPLQAGDRVLITGLEGGWPTVELFTDFGSASQRTTARCH